MELDELNDLFNDNDEEIVNFINSMRTYNILPRVNFLVELDDKNFYRRFRITKKTAKMLSMEIETYLEHTKKQYHEVDIITQLLITLRFYATGNFYISIGDFGGLHKSTAGRIIKRVTNAIVLLRPKYIKFPGSAEEKKNVQVRFFQTALFPKVIGALDCTHVPIQSPGGDNAEVYRNRKGWFSINVQVVCDCSNYIMDIVSRWPGSCHDSHIFSNSLLRARFESGEFGHFLLVGDSGYSLKKYLMTPVADPITAAQQLYNEAHISTRCVIERTFGILKRRFPILSCGMRCALPLAQQIIIATAIIHNIVLNRDSIDDEEEINVPEANEFPQQDENILLENAVQQELIDYFETLL